MLERLVARIRRRCPLHSFVSTPTSFHRLHQLLTTNVAFQSRESVVLFHHAVQGTRCAVYGALCRRRGQRLLLLRLGLRHGALSCEARPIRRRSIDERARCRTLRRRGRHLEGHIGLCVVVMVYALVAGR
jgi:hypothetical protein